MIIWADVFVMPILHTETTRYRSKLDETKTFIQMPCVSIALNYRIELQDPEAQLPPHFLTIQYKLFPDMKTSDFR